MLEKKVFPMKPKWSRLDVVLNVLALLILAAATWLAVSWDAVPELVPIHYDAAGAIDRYAPKSELVILLSVTATLVVLLTAVEFIPRSRWNLGRTVTEDTRARAAAVVTHLLASLKLLLAAVFGLLTVASALGGALPRWGLLFFLAAALVTLLYWFSQLVKASRT